MRLFVSLAIVFVALLVAAVRQATSKHGRGATSATTTPPPEAELDSDTPPPPRAASPPHLALASGEDGARGGVAHLHGRVLPAPGHGEETLAVTTTVVADDGTRSFTIETTDDGRFSFHLPPGRYELNASADKWSGSVADVVARAGTDRAIDIQLEEGATISGVLRGAPAGGDIDVSARLAGRFTDLRAAEVSNHNFEITGLLPGRRYDLDIRGSRARTVILREVTAPARHLDIELVPLPVLRGAFGFPRDGECPIGTVTVTLSADSDDNADTGVGDDCRFEITLPMPEASVQTATVAATGSGWHVEQTITVPARGDPDPVCLNPPCRANPLDGSARVLVMIDGHHNSFTTVRAGTKNGPHSIARCTDGTCVLEPLSPNRTYHVTASAEGCQDEVRDVAVTAGDNTVRFTCRREREIQGVLRAAGAPPAVDVRCTGGVRNVRKSRLFAITCAADDAALQYRVLPDGVWRSAAIPSAEDPPLVEIPL